MALIIPVRGFNPEIGRDTFLAENATIIGDVVMGEECSVWFNTVIRGDVNSIRIGNRVNIQDGSVLHTLYQKSTIEIGNDVSIGHNVTIHGAKIHDYALIGMGAVVMDDAEVGEGALVRLERKNNNKTKRILKVKRASHYTEQSEINGVINYINGMFKEEHDFEPIKPTTEIKKAIQQKIKEYHSQKELIQYLKMHRDNFLSTHGVSLWLKDKFPKDQLNN